VNITDAIFTDSDKARVHLEALLWPNGPVCPHCGESERVKRLSGKSTRPGLIQCNACLKNFTVTVGTVFERSKIALNKWLLASFLLSSSKKGMSSHQLHRMLGVTYKTAWFMAHRIREAMNPLDPAPLGGPGKVIESDEAFVGGFKKKRLSGNVAPKKKVVTLVERGGAARSFHITHVNFSTVRAALVTSVDRASHLRTDDARFYNTIGKEFASHETTLHSNREFSRGNGNHSNTVENFFSILKRGVIGTYHHMSSTHMHRYLAEFDFRYSTKTTSDGERTDNALKGIAGKRLTYRRPYALAA
jgi:transposase-like protein